GFVAFADENDLIRDRCKVPNSRRSLGPRANAKPRRGIVNLRQGSDVLGRGYPLTSSEASHLRTPPNPCRLDTRLWNLTELLHQGEFPVTLASRTPREFIFLRQKDENDRAVYRERNVGCPAILAHAFHLSQILLEVCLRFLE